MKVILKKVITYILTKEAQLVLHRYRPKIVGITGTVGKTSTKDAIYTALSSSLYVRKSDKSYNAELGIALTILGCKNAWGHPLLWFVNILKGLGVILLPNHYPKWLVLEIGVDRPLEIEKIVRWLKLDVVVFTRFSTLPVHVEFFESPKAIIDEKKKLVKALKPGGAIVINHDDDMVREFALSLGKPITTYGIDDGADVRATHREIQFKDREGLSVPAGIHFKVEYDGNVVPVTVPGVLGQHQAYPILAGVAVAATQDINLVKAGQTFMDHEIAPGRMRLVDGLKGTTIIDDSYNSSPIALEAALETLGSLKVESGRRVYILGDMMELGKYSVDAHKDAGALAKDKGKCGLLITVGTRAHYIAEGANSAGLQKNKIVEFETSKQAAEKILDLLNAGDVVLVKGSQSGRMERVVEKLMAEPAMARELLVRQDKEWLKR